MLNIFEKINFFINITSQKFTESKTKYKYIELEYNFVDLVKPEIFKLILWK
jgi:hypothetical protein